MFTKRLTFQLTSPVTSDSFDSPAETNFFTSQTQTLVTVLNVNKKFSQTDKFSRPWFSQNRRQNFGSGAAEKKSCCLLKHRFTILTNKILCSTLALYVSKHRCCNYRRRSTTKINRFRTVGNFHRTSLWPPKNKCRFATFHEQNNSFHLNLTSCKHRHRYLYSGIIQIINSL